MDPIAHFRSFIPTVRDFARGALLAATAGVLLATPLFATPQPGVTFSGCGGAEAAVHDAGYEAQVVELVNQLRAEHGDLPPLKQTAALTAAARYHAVDMGSDDYFDHATYDRSGQLLVHICDAFDRIGRWYANWSNAAENLGAGYAAPEQVVASWMSSPDHRDNLLSPHLTEIGVGYAVGSGHYGVYWVATLGARRSVYPAVINREAAVTDSRTVEVYVYGAWADVRLRNDGDAWSAWQPFRNRISWTLANRAGEQTVTVEVRNAAASAVMSDTITVDIAAVSQERWASVTYLPVVNR